MFKLKSSLYKSMIRVLPKRVIMFLTVMSLWKYCGEIIDKPLINPLTLGRMNKALHLANKNESLMVGVYSYKLQIDDELKTMNVKTHDGILLSNVHDLICKKTITREEFNSLTTTIVDFIVKQNDNVYTRDIDSVFTDVRNTLIVGSVISIV